MKKSILFKTSLLAVSLGILSGCSIDPEKNNDPIINGGSESTVTQQAKSVQTLQAVTGINLVDNLGLSSSNLAVKKSDDFRKTSQKTDVSEVLPQLDLLLSSDNLITSKVEEVETVVGEETFAFNETITFKDVNLEDVTYNLVYNQKTFEEKDDDEIEKFTKMDGLVLLSETEVYPFESRLSEETEDDEFEQERFFKIKTDDRNYVLVEESYENEGSEVEREFEYTLIKDGRKELEYSIEIEKERFENDIEFEIDDLEYKVEKVVKDDKEYFLVKIKDDDHFIDFQKFEKVIAEDGSVSYIEIE